MADEDRSTFGPNEWLVEEMFDQYKEDPNSVSDSWREFFADYRIAPTKATTAPAAPPAPAAPAPQAAPTPVAAATPAPASAAAPQAEPAQ